MSKIIASAAIRGAYKIVEQAEEKWKQAMDKWGANEPVGFPNTAYYLPVIYGILGEKVEKLGDMERILKKCRTILPPPVRAGPWAPRRSGPHARRTERRMSSSPRRPSRQRRRCCCSPRRVNPR